MKPVYYFGVAVIAGVIGLSQLGVHKHHSATLAAAIAAQDKAGIDTTGTQGALMTYSAKHMGAAQDVYLAAGYQRASDAAAAATSGGGSGQVYSAAQAACASKADSIRQSQCVQAYLGSHASAAPNPQVVAPPNQQDYMKSFSSPAFSADSAGLGIAMAVIAAVAGLTALWMRRT